MYKNTKKLLSLILALILVCSCLNMSIVATELSTPTGTEKEKYEAVLPDGVESYEFTSASSQQSNNSSPVLAVTDTIADGVYCFASSLVYRWMSIENESYQAGKHVQHTYSTTNPTQTFSKAMLFKISQVGTTGRYIIRSMINNNLSFGISGSEVITKTIPNDDNDVSATDTFYIEASGNGYFIRPYGSSYVINLVSASTANLGVVAKTSATDNAKWTMYKYTGTHQSGMILYRPSSWGSTGNIVGTTSQATIVSWSTYINANELNVTAASGYEDLATVTWNDSTKAFTITANNPGTMRVSAKIVYGGTTTSVYNGYFTHVIVPQQGTYYIQNAGTEKYIDVEGPSTASGAIIQQWQFHTGNSEKWTLQHVSGSGGYVRLKSVLSNLYLGVDSSNTASIKQYSTQNDYTLWKIERTSAGNQMLICKATESSGLVLSVPLSSNINGTDLTQLSYTENTNYRDEWYINKKVVSFVNYYDSSISNNSTLLQNIPIANSFANIVYSRNYNIGMYMDGSADSYETTIDNCKIGSDSPCTYNDCGTDCYPGHHKNGFAISTQLYNAPREADHLYVLWTNRPYGTYCHEPDANSTGTHELLQWIAGVYNKRPVIHFMTIDGSSTVQLACMTLNIVHESAHTLGMHEAYIDDEHDVTGDTKCVMERFHASTAYSFYQDVLNGIEQPFCSSCNQSMQNYLSNVSIPGN